MSEINTPRPHDEQPTHKWWKFGLPGNEQADKFMGYFSGVLEDSRCGPKKISRQKLVNYIQWTWNKICELYQAGGGN